jgi:hypothetical protein
MTTTANKPLSSAAELRAHELRIIDGAAYWTAFVRVDPFDRRRVETATQEDAIAAGARLAEETGKRLAMVYAVDSDGRSTLAGTVGRDGCFRSAVTQA